MSVNTKSIVLLLALVVGAAVGWFVGGLGNGEW